MIGAFLSRALILALGYAYPAYECYKTVELNKPEIARLRSWCQYWILVAILTVLERFADPLISWLPMYGESKLIFFIYLWYPKTKGTDYIYGTFFKPFISKHEREIDRNLIEVRTRASDMAVLHFQKILVFVQNLIFEGLKYVSVPIIPKNATVQTRETNEEKNHVPTKTTQTEITQETLKDKKLTRTKSTKDKKEAVAPPPSPVVKKQVAPSSPVESELEGSSSDEEKKEVQTEESVMEETIRVTRAKLRKRMGNIGTGTETTSTETAGTGTKN